MDIQNQPVQIMIVEDEPKLDQLLVDYLQAAGYATRWLTNGNEVVPTVHQHPPALILLDLMLPGADGLTVCRELRRFSDVPIVMVTAKIEEIDRLLGLEIGADDYVAKPFSPREVSARVRTILRRLHKQQRLQQSAPYHFGAFALDEDAATISYHQRPLSLTRYEYLLLKTLLLAPGRVFSRQQLMESVWAQAEESLDRTVDTHIKTLRAKLRAVEPGEPPIHTHRGLGYSVSRQP